MIRTLLIANRGEIACRIARTCRDLGIRTVAIHSDADRDALHVRACDTAVHLPGDSPTDTYLRVELVIAAARRSGADAIHPGYGFLAERADAARAVRDAGLIWVGPSPEAIDAMGSKIDAKARMRAAGVPVLADSTVESIDEIGFPLLIKASAGGGGRGMRIVRDPTEFDGARAAAEREAAAAFGDGTVFAEQYIEHGRHVEVQIFGDVHGDVVALFERDCSVQRRHQKIVEEAPSPAVDPALRDQLCTAAVTAARDVGYVGAGTVEFLLAPDGRFAFLEMNTRLQVEHPVTEMITGLDLVALQLAVADGRPLPPEVHDATITGHAVEVRLTAEDPAAGYLPATGDVHLFEVPRSAATLRVDTGIASGSTISPHYDSMVAKVIAHGPTRDAALRRLGAALRDTRIHGPTTNLEQLRAVLEHPEFVAGDADTGFLDRHPCTDGRDVPDDVPLAAALALAAHHRSTATVVPGLPSGWRNNPAVPRSVELTVADEPLTVRYRLGRDPWFEVADADGARAVGVVVVEHAPDRVVLERDGLRSSYLVHLAGDPSRDADGISIHVQGPDGGTRFGLVPRFPVPGTAGVAGSLTAPMPGAIRRIHVMVGDEVTAGMPLVALEAMKMEHQIVAPADGTVAEILVVEGQQVDTGQTLLRLDDDRDDVGDDRSGSPRAEETTT